VPAGEIETIVVDQVRAMLRAPEVVVATWRFAQPEIEGLPEAEIRAALAGLDPLWDELFPAEQARVRQLPIARLDLGADGLKIRLRVDGRARMVQELSGIAAGHRKVVA
jgi:site-specific DNA recombinase